MAKKKIAFMFGAGAELSYGLPTGGDFALNIFRHDSSDSKNAFKAQREKIDRTSRYAQWLPDDFEHKNITVFGNKAYEDIIRGTVEQNREQIIDRLNNLDELANNINRSIGFNVDTDFEEVNGRKVSDSYMDRTIQFVAEFKDGDALFHSNYFSALIMAYKQAKIRNVPEKTELSRIIMSILQLQVGALGEKLLKRINDGIFQKKDDELDILDDIGDVIQLNYQAVGMSGLEYLLEIRDPNTSDVFGRILKFSQKLIEKIYSCVLDYKTLIDSNWMYLYHPSSEWGKFCKIFIFLLNVHSYISGLYDGVQENKKGYYDDIALAVADGKIEINTIGTSNYSPLAERRIKGTNVIHLNGSTELWYDPYLNKIGAKAELEALSHFIVPLLFTQSGTKPMISIDMSSRYVDYYNRLKEADEICVIGFGFNGDDEHINGLFRDLIDKHQKGLTVVTNKKGTTVKKEIANKLKLQDESKITVLSVDENRMRNGKLWVDCLKSIAESE